jgi:hypothetical protein
MNYQRIYDEIIEHAKPRGLNKKFLEGYFERHHIIPLCMHGTNDKSNLVLLTGREHYLCHKLLTKMYSNNQKIIFAYHRILYSQNFKTPAQSSKEFENFRLKHSNFIRSLRIGQKASNETKIKMKLSNANKNKGRKHSNEFKVKIKEVRKFQKILHSDETKIKMSKSAKLRIINNLNTQPSHLGYKHSEESRLKISASKKNCIPWNKGIKQADYK